jgi:hypothetical protein
MIKDMFLPTLYERYEQYVENLVTIGPTIGFLFEPGLYESSINLLGVDFINRSEDPDDLSSKATKMLFGDYKELMIKMNPP